MKKRMLSLLLLVSLLGAVLSGSKDGSAAQTPEDRGSANEITVGIGQDLDDSLDPHKACGRMKEVMFNVSG